MLIAAYQYRHVELPALRLLRCVHRPRMVRDDWRPVGVTLIENTSPRFDEVRLAFEREEDVTWWLDEDVPITAAGPIGKEKYPL